jgi:hypothetical protein
MSRADLNLVVSLCSGLGSHQLLDDGRRVYVKDSDCLGGCPGCEVAWQARRPNRRLPRHWPGAAGLAGARCPGAQFKKASAVPACAGAKPRQTARRTRPPPAAACLKDLQRCLRRDDPDTRDVFFKLGEFDTAKNDLVPIIVTYPDDTELVYNTRAWPQMQPACLARARTGSRARLC